jgi:hypothetical protein
MESQPTKRGVPLGYGLANEETDGAYSIFLRTYGCRTCRLHGARKPTSIKAGPNHPNYRHGTETLQAKRQRSSKLAELRMIENDLRNSGLIKGNRTAGRKPTGG